MRRTSILFFLIVGSLAGYVAYGTATDPNITGYLEIGSKAPDFTIKDESGKETRLSDYRGKLVLLNFFRTDCEPCVEEMPDLEAMNKMFQGRPFQMMLISRDPDWKTIGDFYVEHHLSMPTWLDLGWRVYRQYNVTLTPETFLIDGKGSIVKHYIGAAEWTSMPVLRYIDNLIRKQDAVQNLPD